MLPIQHKKPSFKCPTFSVPAKSLDGAVKPIAEKKRKKDSVPPTPADEVCGAEEGKKEPQPKKDKKDEPPKDPEPKKELQKEPKPKKHRPPAMPVRSLTDAEYEDLFTAAIESAMQIDMEVWQPKMTPPVVVKPRRGKITVGKKTDPNRKPVYSPDLSQNTAVAESGDCTNAVGGGVSAEEECVSREGARPAESDQPTAVSTGLDSDDGPEAGADNDQASNGQLEEPRVRDEPVDRVEEVQQQNETTPAVSEADFGPAAPHTPTSPPAKKKKKQNMNKAHQLEPKALPFSDSKNDTYSFSDCEDQEKSASTSKVKQQPIDTPIKEKIKRLKQMKKEHAPSHKKKTIVRDDVNKSVLKKHKKLGRKTNHKRQLSREIEENGTWVQCCNSSCMKWRHLLDVHDPAQVPERWTCTMNTRGAYNRCDKAEESYDEDEHIYTKFTEGSVVWAKTVGYPWWPAMVESDPDAHTYFTCETQDAMFPTHYHVVFFDNKVSRCWVKAAQVRQFTGSEDDDVSVRQVKKKGPSYKQEINLAKKNAKKAYSCSLKERIELFGFAARFKGKWGTIVPSPDPESDVEVVPAKKQRRSAVGRTVGVGGPADPGLLDDDTLDDALNNTESILDNVEHVLDSLNSQLDDSEQDGEFIPDELVVVESRKQRKYLRGEQSASKKRKADSKPDEEPNEDQKSCSNNDSISPSDTASDENIDSTEKTTEDNRTNFKLDSEIYTMELDEHQETNENVESALAESKIEKTKDSDKKSTDVMNNDSEIVKNQCQAMDTNIENASGEEVPKKKKKTKKQQKEKKQSVETNEGVAAKQEVIQSKPVKKKVASTKQSPVENKSEQAENQTENERQVKKKKSSSATNSFIAPAAKTNESVQKNSDLKSNTKSKVKPETNVKKAKRKMPNVDLKNESTNQAAEEMDLGLQTCEIGKFHEDENDHLLSGKINTSESDDDFDLGVEEQGSVNKAELVTDPNSDVVPDIAQKTQSQESKLTRSPEVNSDSDFDLEEHSMYDDDDVAGDAKIRERDVITVMPAGMSQHSEDSDPFDLMEE